jgi:serine protease AprX
MVVARAAHGVVALAVAGAAVSTLSPLGTASASNHFGAYDPATDGYSMASMTSMTGVTEFWDQGITGAGVDVAVIDTGVSPVEGLATAGKIVYGPDLSFESQVPQLTHLDTNGHGTFMAGLIAGKDSTLTAPYSAEPASEYRGVAPDSRIVSVKVGVADGGVDVTQVIAAINWVVDHKNDDGLNIRVLNLSFGTNSLQSYQIDPLAHAAERAWRSGIVVVAAAGNTGYQKGVHAPGLASPAFSPNLIAVGGYDTMGTAAWSDDRPGSYSASAKSKSARRPDFVAPGSRLQGLRVPGSFVDTWFPWGRLGERYFRGSGTSEAAAVTSGIAALILQQHPTATPAQVKAMLRSETRTLTGDRTVEGRGALVPEWMAYSVPSSYSVPSPATFSNGTGSIDVSRGTDRLTRDGVVLRGEIDIFGRAFLPGTSAQPWVGGTWRGSTWSGSSWSGSSWSGSSWSGSSWSGSSWSGSSWSGSSWSGSSWSGSSWSGSSWSGCSWSGSSWSGAVWAGSSWG